jgi:hypothetical protein
VLLLGAGFLGLGSFLASFAVAHRSPWSIALWLLAGGLADMRLRASSEIIILGIRLNPADSSFDTDRRPSAGTARTRTWDSPGAERGGVA